MGVKDKNVWANEGQNMFRGWNLIVDTKVEGWGGGGLSGGYVM